MIEHVYGPVPSRRLGRSLGVDIIPHKVCTLDCVYCQVGRTTDKRLLRATFVDPDGIVHEVAEKIEHVQRPDYISMAGSGEPTLHEGLDRIIDGIKAVTDVPVAVLTNGTLFFDKALRDACTRADVVMPSLDAGDEETFRRVNRPVDGLTLEKVVDGMAAFREEFSGQIWLEVFLVAGANDSPDQVRKIAAQSARIRPDRIQLNTAVRPTADEGVRALSPQRMDKLCKLFGPTAEVIADFKRVHEQPAFAARSEEVLATIRRRPVTVDDIAVGLGIHRNGAVKFVEELLAKQAIIKERRGEKDYFRCAEQS